MGPDVIRGLSAHVLLVHIVVVFVPLAALLVILSAVWPAARRRLGIITPIVALIAVASIPPTVNAGEWLIKRVQGNPLVYEHAELAGGLLPWAVGMLAFAVVIWALWAKQHWFVRGSSRPSGDQAPRPESLATGASKAATAVLERTTETAVRVRTTPTWLRIVRVVAVVLAIVVSVGSVVDVYRIGDSGARAVWQTSFSMVPNAPK